MKEYNSISKGDLQGQRKQRASTVSGHEGRRKHRSRKARLKSSAKASQVVM